MNVMYFIVHANDLFRIIGLRHHHRRQLVAPAAEIAARGTHASHLTETVARVTRPQDVVTHPGLILEHPHTADDKSFIHKSI